MNIWAALAIIVSLIAICVTLLLALLGAVARFSTISGDMQATIRQLEKGLDKVSTGLKALEEIPQLRIQIEQVRHLYANLQTLYEAARSDISELKAKVAGVRARQSSYDHINLEGEEDD